MEQEKITTCEEYVLNELKLEKEKNEELKKNIAELNEYKKLIETVRKIKNEYILKCKICEMYDPISRNKNIYGHIAIGNDIYSIKDPNIICAFAKLFEIKVDIKD